MMKTLFKRILLVAFVLSIGINANAFKGYYQGIGKMAGKPSDLWVSLELDGEDADFNIGETYKFMGAYTVTGSGDNLTVTIKVPGRPECILKTDDGGDTFTGKVSLPMDQNLDLWLLSVPKKLKPAEESAETLKSIVGSPDGYTSFLLMYQQSGVYCVTSEIGFTPEGRFSIEADTPTLQELIGNMKGSYSIEGNKLILKTDKGPVLNGNIYNEGKYIKIDLSQSGRSNLSMILIR